MHIEASKEIILIVTEQETLKEIVKVMVEAGRLNEPGTGIIFTVPVENLIGLHHRKDFNNT